MSGDVELNPGHNWCTNYCGILFKKQTKPLDAMTVTKWSTAGVLVLMQINTKHLKTSEDSWYCPNCVAPCGICYKGNVHNWHPAIMCDSCSMWIHNSCSGIASPEYRNIQNRLIDLFKGLHEGTPICLHDLHNWKTNYYRQKYAHRAIPTTVRTNQSVPTQLDTKNNKGLK